MVKNTVINYDLENSPLKIRTDSAVGSGHNLRIFFYQSSGTYIGGVSIYLSTTPRCFLYKCHTSNKSVRFSTSLPADVNRIWKITKTSDPLGILIHCNNKEILNFQFSDTTCTEKNWKRYWDQEMKRIRFWSGDTASDFYYHLPGKKSTRKLDGWLLRPIIHGTIEHNLTSRLVRMISHAQCRNTQHTRSGSIMYCW